MIHLRFSQILSGPGLGISPIGLSLIWPIHGVGLSRTSETNHSTADTTNDPWMFFELIARHCRGCCQEHPSPRAPQRRRRVRCVGGGKADSPARMDGDARLAKLLQSVKPDWLKRVHVPSELRGILRPAANECVVRMAGGLGFAIRGTAARIIPDEWNPDSVLPVGNMIDRCAVGLCGISGMIGMHDNFLFVAFGQCHDAWNAVRKGCKKVSGGSCWRSIIRLSAIGNLPHGPMRTGAWGRQLQELRDSRLAQSVPSWHECTEQTLVYGVNMLCHPIGF